RRDDPSGSATDPGRVDPAPADPLLPEGDLAFPAPDVPVLPELQHVRRRSADEARRGAGHLPRRSQVAAVRTVDPAGPRPRARDVQLPAPKPWYVYRGVAQCSTLSTTLCRSSCGAGTRCSASSSGRTMPSPGSSALSS